MSRTSIGSERISFAGGPSFGDGTGTISRSSSSKSNKILKSLAKKVANTLVEDTKLEDVPVHPSHIAAFEDDYVFDPNSKKHKDHILDEATEQVEAVAHERKYQVKKWVYFSACLISNIVGIFVTLFALGASDLFNSFERNNTTLYCSFIFYAPTLLWLRVVYCPGREEALWRQYVMQRRAWRKKVYYQQRRVFLGRDIEEAREAEEEAVKEAIKVKHSRAMVGLNSTSIGSDNKKMSKTPSMRTSITSANQVTSKKDLPVPPKPILQSQPSAGPGGGDRRGSTKRISFQV